MRTAVLFMAAALVISGCTTVSPALVECLLPARCHEVAVLANSVLPRGAERLYINEGRSPASVFHAEVHACYQNGRYILVDVMGSQPGPLGASIRNEGRDDPPCR